jgi:uncharacterized membrane protein YsdA (DUF1294 family)
MLSINQVLFQRWVAVAIWGALGLGLVLAGALSSEESFKHKAVGVLFQFALWNVGFVACVAALVAIAFAVSPLAAELIGISLPYIIALWLLVLGVRFASSRWAIIAIAVIACLLLLLQCLIFGAGILLSPYHFEHRTQSQLALAVVIVTGVAFVWWYLRAKLVSAG